MSEERVGRGFWSLSDVAEYAEVSVAAVTNWRKRYEDFPEQTNRGANSPTFDPARITEWLTAHRRNPRVIARSRPAAAPRRRRDDGDGVEAPRESLWSFRWRRMMEAASAADLPSDRMSLLWGAQVTLASLSNVRIPLTHPAFAKAAGQKDASQLESRWVRALQPALAERPLHDLGHADRRNDLSQPMVRNRLWMTLLQRTSPSLSDSYTPFSLAQYVKSIAEVKRGHSVLNPCIGSGLLTALVATTGSSVVGHEVDTQMAAVAELTLRICGNSGRSQFDSVVLNIDSLRDESDGMLFDRVIAFPPVGTRPKDLPRTLNGNRILGVDPGGDGDVVWINLVASRLASRGIGIVGTTRSVLSRRSRPASDLRKRLVETGLLECVILLPNMARAQQHNALLILSASRVGSFVKLEDSQVLFVDLRTRESGASGYRQPHIGEMLEITRGALGVVRESEGDLPRSSTIITGAELRDGDFLLDPQLVAPIGAMHASHMMNEYRGVGSETVSDLNGLSPKEIDARIRVVDRHLVKLSTELKNRLTGR